ncbi:MAG: gfo/Idh/MocA family oxidoreductase, partial [Planctomycetaceae bacterium]|nr:gfo/Idh/MocA family oxidoreductase [Planctomycetaceae bacterium]
MSKTSRRKFLSVTAAAAVPLFVPGYVLGRDRGVSPSEKINTVSIGLGNRGGEIIGGFLGNQNYQVRGVCDVFAERTVSGKKRVD